MEEFVPDELDYKILNLIANDARISFLEVSRLCNVSGAAVHQRVQKLTSAGVITGSEFWLDLPRIGYHTCAFLSLHFNDTHHLDAIVEQLRGIREVVECHSITGQYDVLVKVYALNNAHLYDIIHTRLKPLGLLRTETLISYRELFHRQVTFGG